MSFSVNNFSKAKLKHTDTNQWMRIAADICVVTSQVEFKKCHIKMQWHVQIKRNMMELQTQQANIM